MAPRRPGYGRTYGHNYGMKTTLMIGEAVLRQAKQRAASLGITLSAFTERSLRDALADRAVAARRITLPTTGHGLPRRPHSVSELKALETDDERS